MTGLELDAMAETTRGVIENACEAVKRKSWPEKGDVLEWLDTLRTATWYAGPGELRGIEREIAIHIH